MVKVNIIFIIRMGVEKNYEFIMKVDDFVEKIIESKKMEFSLLMGFEPE